MALGMKCSPSFKPAGFQLPILNVEDLGVQASPTADILAGSQPSTLTEPHGSKQMTLAMISVEFARLCIIFCKIPSSPREVGLSQHGEALRIANGAGVDSILATAFRIRDCAAELSGWYKNLPAQVRGPDTDTNNVARGDTSVDLNQGLLQMSYFTAITDLYLPQVLLLSNNAQPLAQKLNKFYRRKLLGAAMEIARVAEYFTSQRLTHYLPSYRYVHPTGGPQSSTSYLCLVNALKAFLYFSEPWLPSSSNSGDTMASPRKESCMGPLFAYAYSPTSSKSSKIWEAFSPTSATPYVGTMLSTTKKPARKANTRALATTPS